MTRTPLSWIAFGSLLLALAIPARATSVTVAARSADGQPAPNVVVQLTPADPGATLPPWTPVVIVQRDIHFPPPSPAALADHVERAPTFTGVASSVGCGATSRFTVLHAARQEAEPPPTAGTL